MKNILYSLLLLCFPLSLFGQSGSAPYEFASDAEFNKSDRAFFFNGTFIKSEIGINTNKKREDVKMKAEDHDVPLEINGVSYKHSMNITTGDETEFVSLQDLREQYCPQLSGRVLYMIDCRIILNDSESYRIEKDYVESCELIESSEIEQFQTAEPFNIFRVYLKKKRPIRIR